MTEHDLRRLLDDAADDRGRTPLSATRLARRSRRDRAVRRTAGVAGMAVGALAVTAGVVGVARSGGTVATEDAPSSSTARPGAPTSTGATLPPGGGGPPVAASECVAALKIDGATFYGVGNTQRLLPLTGEEVDAVVPACNDTGGPPGDDDHVRVQVLQGVSPDIAVSRLGTLYVRNGAELPSSTDSWFDPLTCSADGPQHLVGRWLGVTTDQKLRFDGDVRAPLRIDFEVRATTPDDPDYVGYTITVRDDGGAQPALDKHMVEEALWSSRALLAVRVHCDGKRFVADSFALEPR